MKRIICFFCGHIAPPHSSIVWLTGAQILNRFDCIRCGRTVTVDLASEEWMRIKSRHK